MLKCDFTENANQIGLFILADGIDRIRFDEYVEIRSERLASATGTAVVRWSVRCDRADCKNLPEKKFDSFGAAYGFAKMINANFKAMDGSFNLIQKLMRGNDD